MSREEARALFTDVVAMAPMAQGGNLPYRRLCKEFGADLTCSEMVLAHKLVKGSRREQPLLRRHNSETPYGIQITASKPEVMGEAARMVEQLGVDYLDLNFGCPIDLMVRKGLGAASLKRLGKLRSMIAAARAATDLPLLVKLRVGWSEEKINILETASIAAEEGADGLSIHGRTREQRYRRDADWSLIDAAAQAVDIPVLGNGDVLTVWDHRKRREETAVAGVVCARGALIKPWIFRELKDGAPWFPSMEERWGVLSRWFELACEHFGDDEKGLGRVERFFLWHQGFWCRYRPHDEADWSQAEGSLIQRRDGWPLDEPEALLLASEDEEDHLRVWARLRDGDHPGESQRRTLA